MSSRFDILSNQDLEVDPFLRQILAELNSTWDSIPHKGYEPEMCATMRPSAIWLIIGPQLEYLYSRFLLHKLLISQNDGDREEMIRTSHEILTLALGLLKNTDIMDAPDLEWIVSCKAVSLLYSTQTDTIADGILRNAVRECSYLRAVPT